MRAALLSAAVILAHGGTAFAQTSPVPPTAEEPADDGGLADIVVTAQKRSENIRYVPLAISAFSSEALASKGVTEIAAIAIWRPTLRWMPELIYANTNDSSALASKQSASRTRYYVQVPPTERLEDWPADRLWDELERCFAPPADRPVVRGPAFEILIAPLRSYVFETMRDERLILAGDAAHSVPPTGANGLNLAASEVAYLADVLIVQFKRGDETRLAGYQAGALARTWTAERFSWSLTKVMHRFTEDGAFERRMQIADFDCVARSKATRARIVEDCVSLPL